MAQELKTIKRKTKDDEFLKAYNNLQYEFTRKCQKLSEVQKSNVEKAKIEFLEQARKEQKN